MVQLLERLRGAHAFSIVSKKEYAKMIPKTKTSIVEEE